MNDKSPAAAAATEQAHEAAVVLIAPRGDVVLDVLFAAAGGSRSLFGPVATPARRHRSVRMLYRIDAATLEKHSRYFSNLLSDTRFQEARTIEAARAELAREQVVPGDAEADRLPSVRIEVDSSGRGGRGGRGGGRGDGAGRGGTLRRDEIFTELLRVLHWDGTTRNMEATDGSGSGIGGTGPETASMLVEAASARTQSSRGKLPLRPKHASVPETSSRKQSRKTAAKMQAHTAVPVIPGSKWSAMTVPTLTELAILAQLADRFACTTAVAAYVKLLRVRYPSAVRVPSGSDSSAHNAIPPGCLANEEAIRQKVYVAWMLDQPLRFSSGTRELVLYGSQSWAAAAAAAAEEEDLGDDDNDDKLLAPWWDLPDGLERELQFRRHCIVDCIASVPRHFLRRYAHLGRPLPSAAATPTLSMPLSSPPAQPQPQRHRLQCSMGYESSAACDAFHLGEMVKFFLQRGLLSFQDFSSSPASLAPPRAARLAYAGDVHGLLAMLRQCPAYQIDKHHVNCGLRTRLLPILEYLQAMLSAGTLGLHRHVWAAPQHGQASWLAAAEEGHDDGIGGEADDGDANGDNDDDEDDDMYDATDDGNDAGGGVRMPIFQKPGLGQASGTKPRGRVFRFTRAVAGDQRLRMSGNMSADRMARPLFTARKWNWTEDSR